MMIDTPFAGPGVPRRRHRHAAGPALWLLAGVLTFCASVHAGELRYLPLTSLDPVTREVAACGVRFDVLVDGAATPAITALLRQRRDGDDSKLEWCVQRDDGLANEVGGDVTLAVTGMEAVTATLPARHSAEVCTAVDAADGLLFQRLFIAGGRLEIGAALAHAGGLVGDDGELAADTPLLLRLQRPLPVALSRAYLNCAGDLFRPEDDD